MGNGDSRLSFNESLSTFSTSSEVSEAFLLTMCSHPVRIEDVFEIVSPDFVRLLRRESPEKLLLLLKHVVDSVYELYEKSLRFPLLEEVDLTRLNTSVRLLTRIIPFINDDGEVDEFTELMWNGKVPVQIDDAHPESVGYRLLGALMRLGFIRGYSIAASCSVPSTLVDPNRIDENLVWGKGGGIGGVSFDRSSAVSSQMLLTRIEILRLFTLLLSRPLFMTLSEYKDSGVPIFNALVCSGDFVHTANLFLSLLLTILDFETCHYAIPILTNSLTDDSSTSPEESLVTLCLLLVNVLVDTALPNAFREILRSGISEKEELDLIVVRFRDKLRSVYVPNSSFSFSVSSKMANWNPFVLFLFNLVNVNPKVIDSFAANSVAGKNLVLSLIFLLSSNLKDPANAGLVHTSSFLLLALSGNRDFVLSVMTQPYEGELEKINLPTIFDFLLVLLVKQVKKQLLSESLMELMLTILCNVSPFVGISHTAALHLLSLLEKMSKFPRFTASIEFLLETMNNCIYYQYEGSSALVYELILPNGRRILANIPDSVRPDLLPCTARLVAFLGPRIEEECRLNEGSWDAGHVSQLVRKISIVGILPNSAIVVRQFQPSEQTKLWFTSYLWGTVFSVLQVLPVIDWKRVKMVTLSAQADKQAPSELASRESTEAPEA